MSTPIYLNERGLESLQVAGLPAGRLARRLRVKLGEDEYTVDFWKLGKPATHTHPAEDPEMPTLGECAQVSMHLAGLVLSPIPERGETPRQRPGARCPSHGSDEQQDGPGPDFAAGWEEYRRQLRETHACVVPAWDDLPMEVRECWCAGVWAVIDGQLDADDKMRIPPRWDWKNLKVCPNCRSGHIAQLEEKREVSEGFRRMKLRYICKTCLGYTTFEREGGAL